MPSAKPRVIIVGGNFAGLAAASRLSAGYDVTVVDARDEFEWTPNIHEILSGVKAPEGVVLPRADCVGRYGHKFLHDEISGIDPAGNSVHTTGGKELHYDACIVAAGGQRTMYGIAGAATHAVGFRLVDDAVRIAGRLETLARRRRRASVAIVGGGVSGIEALGEILRRRACDDEFDVHVVEIASRLLPQQPGAVADDVLRRIAAHNVHIHTDAIVTGVSARRVTLASGESLAADLCIWSAGMELPKFLRGSPLHRAGDAWLPVDDTLQSRNAQNVFVAGDCAALPEPVRKQAYYAMDMGAIAGDNVARFVGGRPLRRFRAVPKPMLIAFGDITTWLVAGEHVVASPLLAAAKEGIYQATMARLASHREPLRYAAGVATRAATAAQRLLLPQLRPARVFSGLLGGRIIA